MVCTGCACLCDDINCEINENQFSRVENACARGAALFYATDEVQRRTICTIKERKTSPEEAVERAAQILRNARNPLIFGLDNSTLEAQKVGIKLAQTLGAVIDDTSSFCHGDLIRAILNGDIPTCSLSEVKDSSNLIIYWGSNPHHSHPRHLSSFSYYPHEESRKTDFMPDVELSCIEVRDTETSLMCHPIFKIRPGEDGKFIQKIIASIRGTDNTPDAKTFVDMVEKADFCVIFAGLGLTYSLDGDFRSFTEMIHALRSSTRVAVVPMVGHFNMRGFNHSLYKETGYVNKISFASGISYGEEFSLLEQIWRGATDCILIAGSDPFLNLPRSLMKKLQDIPIICLDPFITSTTRSSDVVLATAVSGIEVGGSAIRMDGEKVLLNQVKSAFVPSDESVLKTLLDMLR